MRSPKMLPDMTVQCVHAPLAHGFSLQPAAMLTRAVPSALSNNDDKRKEHNRTQLQIRSDAHHRGAIAAISILGNAGLLVDGAGSLIPVHMASHGQINAVLVEEVLECSPLISAALKMQELHVEQAGHFV